MIKIRNNRLFYYILFALSFISIFVFLIWKCKIGFPSFDEAFYLATPLRLCQGDALFVDEWHVSQMSSVLIFPFVAIYRALFNSTVGMILTFRYVFVTVNAIAAVFFFFRLKKYSYLGALVASLAFLLYVPYCISAMSYNSLGIINLSVACVLLLTSEKYLFVQYIFVGIFFSAACLCCPYLAIAFFLYVFLTIVLGIIKKIKPGFNNTYIFKINTFIPIVIGIVISILTFAIFVFSRAPLKEIISNFSYILSDPEHISIGLLEEIKNYFLSVINITTSSKTIYILLICFTIIGCLYKKSRKFMLGISSVLIIWLLIETFLLGCINFVMFPLNVLALISVILVDNRTIRKIFATIWIPGMAYSFCLHLGSNQLYYCITSASTVALIGSLLIISIVIRECLFSNDEAKMGNALVAVTMCFLCLLQLFFEADLRYQKVFWEDDTPNLSFEVTEGVEKGLIESEFQYNAYNNFIDATSVINEYTSANNILFFTSRIESYLMFPNLRNASFSGCISIDTDTEFAVEKLNQYYDKYKDKTPDLVYVEAKYFNYIEKMNYVSGYSSRQLSDGGLLFVRP